MWLLMALMMSSAQPAGARPGEVPVQRQAEGREKVAGVDQVPVRIYLVDQTGGRFRLVEARVVLDAREVLHETAPLDQALQRDFSAPETRMPPGEHALIATLTYEGQNRGPFRYLDNYRYQVQRVYPFSLESADKPAVVHLVRARATRAQRAPGKKAHDRGDRRARIGGRAFAWRHRRERSRPGHPAVAAGVTGRRAAASLGRGLMRRSDPVRSARTRFRFASDRVSVRAVAHWRSPMIQAAFGSSPAPGRLLPLFALLCACATGGGEGGQEGRPCPALLQLRLPLRSPRRSRPPRTPPTRPGTRCRPSSRASCRPAFPRRTATSPATAPRATAAAMRGPPSPRPSTSARRRAAGGSSCPPVTSSWPGPST